MNSKANVKEMAIWLIPNILSSALIAAIVSGWVSLHTSSNDIKARYVDIAVQVLTTNKECEDKEFREWAVDVLNEYIPEKNLKIKNEIKQRLIDCKTRIPVFGWGNIIEQGSDNMLGNGFVGQEN